DGVVEQRRDDGGAVQLHLGQDVGDLEGMAEIGVAGGPLLRAVGLHRENIGAIEGVLIRAGVVGLDGLNELELAAPRGGSLPLGRAGPARACDTPPPTRPGRAVPSRRSRRWLRAGAG